MEESSGQYPLVNVNRGLVHQSGQGEDHPQGSVGPHTGDVDFDPRNLIPVPIVFCDDEGQIVWLNSATEDLTGFSSHHLVGKTFVDLFPEEKRTAIVRKAIRWRRRGAEDLYLEEPIQTAALKPHWIGVRVKRVPAPVGKEVFVCSLHDLQAMRDELESLLRQVSELEARTEEAAASVELKSEFIRTVSEDLRAPMSGVVGMSRFLLETELNPEQQTFAEVIENSGQQLLDVVDDLLDFSRIEAGELQIQSIDFDLRVAVEAVAVTLGTRATDRHRGFSFGVDRSVQSQLIGDPGRFRQVLLNLGETVIEETSGGDISLHVGLAEETARGLTLSVTIETTGQITAGAAEGNVFQVFASEDSSELRRLGSRGLRLNLCRQILSLMRGEVCWMADGTVGLSFRLPFQKQVLPEITSAPEEIGIDGAQVVVGDSVPENGTWLAETLAGWGCTVMEVSSAEQVTEILRQKAEAGFKRCVAMIDLDLPGLSTEDLATAIHADESISATPLIMITSIGRRGDAELATRLGFRAYLTKPIEPVDLREAISEVLRMEMPGDGSSPLITRHLLAERRHAGLPVELSADGASEEPAERGEEISPDPAYLEPAVESGDGVSEPPVEEDPVDGATAVVVPLPGTDGAGEAPAEPEIEVSPSAEGDSTPESMDEVPSESAPASSEEEAAPEIVGEETPAADGPVANDPAAEAAPAETPEAPSGDLEGVLQSQNDALQDLKQVLGLQATLAKGRLRKAVEIGNRREIEWEARSLDKMYGATGSDELSRQFRALAVLANSGEMSEIQSAWANVEKLFEEGSPPQGTLREAA